MLLACSFRHHSCYVYLFICGHMQAFLIFFFIYPPREHHRFVRNTTFWVKPPGIHFSPRKYDKTFLSNAACSFPLKHFSAEAAKWLHNIILYKAGRNAISEHLCLTPYCPCGTSCRSTWILIQYISTQHTLFKLWGSVSPLRSCIIFFLCCSSVTYSHPPSSTPTEG